MQATGTLGPVAMSTATVSVFFALLSLLCIAAVVAVAVLAVIRRFSPDSGAAYLFDDLGRLALGLAALVAVVTTGGSLYFSQIAGFVPCELCWVQRIAMYPLALILTIAAVRRDRQVWIYVVPLAVLGGLVSIYHTQLQAFPAQKTFCATLTPCSTRYVWEFGFVSLPFMALTAFAFIVTMLLVARATGDDDSSEAIDQTEATDQTEPS